MLNGSIDDNKLRDKSISVDRNHKHIINKSQMNMIEIYGQGQDLDIILP
jgi:hypothetical protein